MSRNDLRAGFESLHKVVLALLKWILTFALLAQHWHIYCFNTQRLIFYPLHTCTQLLFIFFVCLSAYLSVHPLFVLSACLPACVCLSVCLPVCLSVCTHTHKRVRMYGWMDGWMDGCMYCHTFIFFNCYIFI